MLISRMSVRLLVLAVVMVMGAYAWTFVVSNRQKDTVHKLGVVSVRQEQTVTKLRIEVAANKRAIGYICSTTSVLDQLVSQQATQIRENFANGTYKHLLELGVIKQNNIDQARLTLAQFEHSHHKLTRHSACSETANQTKGGNQ